MSEPTTKGLFDRGISEGFVQALNALPNDSWWRRLLGHEKIFVAIRDEKLNAYYKGCSLAEIAFENGEITARTHYKYLIRPVVASPYLTAVDGKFSFPDEWRGDHVFSPSFDHLDQIMRAADRFAGKEKSFVGTIVKNNPNTLDVEIAMTAAFVEEDSEDETLSALRIDIAALVEREDALELMMYEAKDFTNRKSLRSSTEAPVIGQVQGYEAILADYNDQLVRSYRQVAENLASLVGIPEPRAKWAAKVARAKNFRVSNLPTLIICGLDEDQKRGKHWGRHYERLEQGLGAHRIIARGSADGVRLT